MQSAASDLISCPLIQRPDPADFAAGISRITKLFRNYASNSPEPIPAPGLLITPEIRYQCELYLPIAEIRRHFHHLYRKTLKYQPILESTPFHNAMSWADCFVQLPTSLQISANPAVILQRLLDDNQLLESFIFQSFIPAKFNGGGFDRYPEQSELIRNIFARWRSQGRSRLRCLDAACGTGEGSWQLVEMLAESGWQPKQVSVEGWTVEPLEVWAAEQRSLPHEPERAINFEQRVKPLIAGGWAGRISFRTVNLLKERYKKEAFDLIICNGLLGGPIINQEADMRKIADSLSSLLFTGGQILVASRFHDGWKKRIPEERIRDLITAGKELND